MLIFQGLTNRGFWFTVAACSIAALAWRDLYALAESALHQEQNSHILLVLPIVAMLLYHQRSHRGVPINWSRLGLVILLLSALLAALSSLYGHRIGSSNRLSLVILSVVAAWIGLALLFFGIAALRKNLFVVFFLFLLIPLPDVLLRFFTRFLQEGSTVLTQGLFLCTGVPVGREGFVLYLPKLTIEVAAECSGIRSTMILLMAALVLSHLYLFSMWRKLTFLGATILITFFKNALRIYTLSMLTMYADPSWMYGKFHHVYGGSVFFTLALGMAFIIMEILRGSERERNAHEERNRHQLMARENR
jgi:exosortase